jgi:hypothetical protein
LGVQSLEAVTYASNAFVAVGFKNISRSVDGINWTSRTVDYWLRGLTYGEGRYVAVGMPLGANSSAILSSSDAVQWTALDPGVNGGLFAVAAGNGSFVALGDQTMLTSADASQWTQSSPPDGVYFQNICFGNGLFLAVGGTGTVFTSANGRDWARHDSQTGAAGPLSACGWSGGFFAVAGGGAFATSPDGTNWLGGQIWPVAVRGIAFGAGSFVLVGDGGTILQSELLP